MRGTSLLTFSLRENLLAVLGSNCTSKQLNAVINLCVALALERLGRKSNSRKLCSVQGMSEKDLAFDSIADLFRRDEEGCFVRLEAYFGSFDVNSVSDQELLTYLRRLVYSRVNQALFRMYQDVDPVLSKILRNIKVAVEAVKQFDEVERFGEICIVPAFCDTLEHLPGLDAEDLQRHLLSACTGNENIPQMLGKLAVFLRQQKCNSRIIPIITVATIFQSVYAIKNEPLLAPPSVETNLFADDAVETIKSVCRAVKGESFRRYVGKKKISEKVFNAYFEVIEESLLARFAGDVGGDHSYFDLLKTRLPDLTPDEYKNGHRAKLEYLGAQAFKQALKNLKSSI
ncbi:MAG: hypothetical protein WBW16_14145 [Bacteroidota bacterium]